MTQQDRQSNIQPLVHSGQGCKFWHKSVMHVLNDKTTIPKDEE